MKLNSQGIAHLIIPLIIIVVAALGYVGYQVFIANDFYVEEAKPGVDTGVKLSIPQEISDNKYGFLTGHPNSLGQLIDMGGAWARPHPGPFLWDAMQEDKTSDIKFDLTDKYVKDNQDKNVGTLATVWPFADWDQSSKSSCKVSDDDEFLPRGGNPFSANEPYLPSYRCTPSDNDAYVAWLGELVERYDGDGVNDMPGLKIPVKHWEILNEPELRAPEGEPEHLRFFMEGPEEYAELLKLSSEAIRAADSEAQILIAGAAGGSDRFLDFYETVLSDKEVVAAFDIANVHCISNDNFENFNVEPYKNLLDKLEIKKPIWVTEAEAIISSDIDINATQTLLSTQKALETGAEKIFYTRYDFDQVGPGGGFLPPGATLPESIIVTGDDPAKTYQEITSQ